MTNYELERKARFKKVIQHLNIDRQALANNLGYKKKYLDQILSAGKNLSYAVALKFTKRYKQVNEEWLMNGKGEMLVDDLVKTYQNEESRSRTEEEFKNDYTADPLAGLKEMLARLESLEKWREDVESRMSPNL